MVSPKKSTRTGCSSVGGKTSTMPPRTANSPRRSTMSTRTYAAATRAVASSVEVDVLTDREADRLQVAESLDLRLQHAADRGDDHLRRRQFVVVGEPSQDGQAPADGVGARAQPLVRQGLPGRVVGDLVRLEQRLQRLGQVLGLPERRGDQEHRHVGTAPLDARREGGRDDRPHGRRRRQVERMERPGLQVRDRTAEGGFGAEEIDESRKGHRETLYRRWLITS